MSVDYFMFGSNAVPLITILNNNSRSLLSWECTPSLYIQQMTSAVKINFVWTATRKCAVSSFDQGNSSWLNVFMWAKNTAPLGIKFATYLTVCKCLNQFSIYTPTPTHTYKHFQTYKSFSNIHSVEMRRFCARPQMEVWLKILLGVIFVNFEICAKS